MPFSLFDLKTFPKQKPVVKPESCRGISVGFIQEGVSPSTLPKPLLQRSSAL